MVRCTQVKFWHRHALPPLDFHDLDTATRGSRRLIRPEMDVSRAVDSDSIILSQSSQTRRHHGAVTSQSWSDFCKI